jgi:hypothetical protein
VAAEAFRQSAASMRRPSQPGIVDLTTAAGGAEGLDAVVQLAADIQTWGDLPEDDLEILLFSLSAFIDKAGTGGGLFRRLLADGSADIARLTGDLATADLVVAASRCAQAWTATARAGIQRDVDVRARLDGVALSASQLPELELDLVESLESASSSLTAR